jgi:TetR/AcrR family transcriptional regulator, transcriptional repressor for nem operon
MPYVNAMSVRSRPRGGPREEAKQRTREALLSAGLALYASEGLDVSLDAICERAGYTRGAFYVHFKDRDDFLVAAMDRVGSGFLDAVLGEGDDVLAAAERFLTSVEDGTYPLTRRGGVRPHQLLDACARSRKVRSQYVKLVSDGMARIAALLRAAQESGLSRRDIDAGDGGAALMAAVIGAHTMLDLGVPFDLRRTASTLLGLLAPRD